METSITSETISQQAVCWQIERPNKDWKFPEVAKKVLHLCHADKKHSNEEIIEIEQTRKNLIKAKEAYFNYIQSQKMARMKWTTKKSMVRDGKGPPPDESGSGKLPRKKPRVSSAGNRTARCRFWLGTKALKEIWWFQKSTELLMPKVSFYCTVCEILQKEIPWYKIEASTILALHEAAKAYLVWLFEDSNPCIIHTKCITIMPKDVQLTQKIRGQILGSVFVLKCMLQGIVFSYNLKKKNKCIEE